MQQSTTKFRKAEYKKRRPKLRKVETHTLLQSMHFEIADKGYLTNNINSDFFREVYLRFFSQYSLSEAQIKFAYYANKLVEEGVLKVPFKTTNLSITSRPPLIWEKINQEQGN